MQTQAPTYRARSGARHSGERRPSRASCSPVASRLIRCARCRSCCVYGGRWMCKSAGRSVSRSNVTYTIPPPSTTTTRHATRRPATHPRDLREPPAGGHLQMAERRAQEPVDLEPQVHVGGALLQHLLLDPAVPPHRLRRTVHLGARQQRRDLCVCVRSMDVGSWMNGDEARGSSFTCTQNYSPTPAPTHPRTHLRYALLDLRVEHRRRNGHGVRRHAP